jgi:glycosyltransferase involved in cell wall biosynthesis
VGGKSLLNKMKFFRINKIVCNSRFTKEIIDKEYGVDSIVIYPPVGIENIKPKRKENIILYVGRFSKILQSKRQDVLIKAFKKIYNNGFSDWKLILAGGAEVGNDGCVDELEKLSENYPIEILVSPSYKELKDLYGKAKFFWSAAGFEENETKNPEKVEHFGITVVEAMAGGAVPVVYNAGGYKEVVENGKTGFLWNRTSELTRFTTSLAEDPKSFREMQVHIKERAKKYDYNIFKERIKEILK